MPNFSHKVRNLIIVFSIAFTLFATYSCVTANAAKWSGVDETVVEKTANEHGRKSVSPLINTDQGDLLLFVFLIAGVTGGFVAGYSWKTLTSKEDK